MDENSGLDITQDIIVRDVEGVRLEVAERFAAARRLAEDEASGRILSREAYRVDPWWERLTSSPES